MTTQFSFNPRAEHPATTIRRDRHALYVTLDQDGNCVLCHERPHIGDCDPPCRDCGIPTHRRSYHSENH